MNKIIVMAAIVVSVAFSAFAGQWESTWANSFGLENKDGNFKFKFGGRIMIDYAWISPDSNLKYYLGSFEDSDGDGVDDSWVPKDGLPDGTEFRRARLFVSGTMYKRIAFKWQFDWAGGKSKLKDGWIGITGYPVGVKVGHFKEPFSLEELTSSKYISFMERSLPNVFAPGRNQGIMVYGSHFEDSRMTWAVGIFREVDDYGYHSEDGGYNGTVRVTGLPWYVRKGRKLFHIGLAYSIRNPNYETVKFKSNPETHLTDALVSTGSIPASTASILGFESALVFNSFSLQGEYMKANIDRYNPDNANVPSGFSDPEFDGYYLYGSWFITGENRHFKNKSASFGRVKPKRNFLDDKGPGAWEVALRYSHLDLVHTARYDDNGMIMDGSIYGGKLSTITLGLNWYLTPNSRVMLNYINADVHNDDFYLENMNNAIEAVIVGDAHFSGGSAHIFQIRFQLDF